MNDETRKCGRSAFLSREEGGLAWCVRTEIAASLGRTFESAWRDWLVVHVGVGQRGFTSLRFPLPMMPKNVARRNHTVITSVRSKSRLPRPVPVLPSRVGRLALLKI